MAGLDGRLSMNFQLLKNRMQPIPPTRSKPFFSLLAAVVIGTMPMIAVAQNFSLYRQDWPWSGADLKSLAAFGWTQVLPASGFAGNYEEPNATDAESNESLPATAVYFGAKKAGPGFFYTTNGAAAKSGQTNFAAIEISSCSNLTFTVEAQQGWQGTNLVCHFAVQAGGQPRAARKETGAGNRDA